MLKKKIGDRNAYGVRFMPEINTVRWEIIANHVLMHVTTLIVLSLFLAITAYVEYRKSILSVMMPLIAVSWAAAMVRFDYLIHRQGAYIAFVEHATGAQGWETWRKGLMATAYVMPLLDGLSVLAIVALTGFVAFGPATQYLRARGSVWANSYRWIVMIAVALLLASLGAVPWLAKQ